MKNKGLSKHWASYYLSTAIIDLMRISLDLTQLINAPDISDANKAIIRRIDNKLTRIIYGTLSDLQNEYFKK